VISFSEGRPAYTLPELAPEYIVVYPYSSNIEMGTNGLEPRLSVLSQMALDAALAVWSRNPAARIVMPGETPFGDALPNTTTLMVRRAKKTPGISDDSLVPLHSLPNGRPLNNTYLQTKALAHHFGVQRRAGTILAVALGFHMPRVRSVVKAYGMKPHFASAEDILQTEGITTYDNYLPHIQHFGGRGERLLALLSSVDGKGRLLNLMMQATGARVNDIIDDGAGGLRPYLSFARQRLKEVHAATATVQSARAE
jgi:hypothetical protein